VKGLAIGASTSGFVADIYMEKIETGALATFINPPSLWCRFVDDTLYSSKNWSKQRLKSISTDKTPI